MAKSGKFRSGIVAVDGTRGPCPVVTFEFTSIAVGAPLVVTLTLCEWQFVARQIAEAATALGS